MSALPRARPRGGVLVASAYAAGNVESEYAKRAKMAWQDRALRYIKIVPELGFASRFYAKMLRQVRFYPAYLEPDGRLTEIMEGPPVETLAQLRDAGGGRSQLQGQYGRLMFTTGEGGLFGRDIATERERWSFIWSAEIKLDEDAKGNVLKIIHMPNGEAGKKTEYTPDEARWYPMWMPSPEFSGEADSPMQAVLEIAEELLILTAAVHSTAVTRLTNGVLFMPQEASPGPAQGGSDEDPEEDPFVDDVSAHFEAQVENPGSAEARVPPVVWMQADLIEKVRHVALHDPQTDYLERELRKEARERLGGGLDMPPEALSGLGSTNHWASMQILGDMWKSHGIGVAQQFATDVADVFLRPALQAEEFERWEDVVIGVDGSQVVVKADRSDDARTGLELEAIGPSGFRRMLHIPEEYAPTAAEAARMREKSAPQPGPREPSRNGSLPAEQPDPPGPEGDSGRRTRVVASAFREMGAAEYALVRCRELAGMRLRNKATWRALEAICLDCAQQASLGRLSVVASVLGPARLEQLKVDPAVLVKGGADGLRELLAGWGYPPAQSEALAEMVELYAARTLFEERTPALPSGFEAQITRTRELLRAVEHQAA